MGAKLVRCGSVGAGLQCCCHPLCPSRMAPAVGQPGDICPGWTIKTSMSSEVSDVIVFCCVKESGKGVQDGGLYIACWGWPMTMAMDSAVVRVEQDARLSSTAQIKASPDRGVTHGCWDPI